MNKVEKLKMLMKKIKTAKELQDKASYVQRLVFMAFDDLGIDLSKCPTNAENADNLEEAVLCYIHYGEFSFDGLANEIYEVL